MLRALSDGMSSTIRRASGFALLALVACAASVGCSKSSPASVATPQAAAAVAPWSSTSSHIELTRFGVNVPREDGSACWTAKYSLGADERTLHVETCVDDDPIVRDLTLADADVQRIHVALAALRETSGAPAKCDDKGSTFLVQIYDESRKLSHYTDSSNTCHKGDMGTIDRTTLEALFTTLAATEPSSHS